MRETEPRRKPGTRRLQPPGGRRASCGVPSVGCQPCPSHHQRRSRDRVSFRETFTELGTVAEGPPPHPPRKGEGRRRAERMFPIIVCMAAVALDPRRADVEYLEQPCKSALNRVKG